VTGQAWWLWMAICVAAWFAAVWLIAAWLDHDDDLAPYRWPVDDDEED